MTENLRELVEGGESCSGDNIRAATNVVDITSDIGGRTLISDNSPYSLSLRRDDIDDEKELKRFIGACERIFRISPEYKVWAEYVRDVLGHIKCDLTHEAHGQITTDIHHHPASLYAITKALVMKRMSDGTEFCSLDIVTDLLEMHYELRIGFVVLIKSLHEKFHNGFLQLPIEIVKGDFQYFIDNYTNYLDDEERDIIMARMVINSENCGYGEQYFWSRDNYPLQAAGGS